MKNTGCLGGILTRDSCFRVQTSLPLDHRAGRGQSADLNGYSGRYRDASMMFASKRMLFKFGFTLSRRNKHRVLSDTAMYQREYPHYTHSNPPLDLDQLGGQVVKRSALESRSRGIESRPSGPVIVSQAIGQRAEQSVLITSRKGKPQIE